MVSLLLLGAGCEKSHSWTNGKYAPAPHQLTGTETEKIALYREHLENLRASDPNASFMSAFLFTRALSEDEFISMMNECAISPAADGGAIALYDTIQPANAFTSLEGKTWKDALDTAYLSIERDNDNRVLRDSHNVRILTLRNTATPTAMLKCWNENDTVRMIGAIAPEDATTFSGWIPVLPDDSL